MTRNRSLSLPPLDTPFFQIIIGTNGGGRAFGLRLFDDDDADDAAGEVERGGNCSDGRGYGGGGDRIWDPGSGGRLARTEEEEPSVLICQTGEARSSSNISRFFARRRRPSCNDAISKVLLVFFLQKLEARMGAPATTHVRTYII